MISFNKFLRQCINHGVSFKRIRFVRREHHRIWDSYFKPGEPVSFTKQGGFAFSVTGTTDRWICSNDSGDCELLSIELTHRGVLVVLGAGSY